MLITSRVVPTETHTHTHTLIHPHTHTHRFYYIPTDAFGMLQGSMPEFLAQEHARFSEFTLVIVLEDAEALLLNRRDDRDGLASSLLNFSVGFVGDLVQAHMICTINGEVKDLDSAVLRPGRQRFFLEFNLIDWNRAQTLAEKLGISLTKKRAYSLAELYHFKDLLQTQRLENYSAPIGFSPNH